MTRIADVTGFAVPGIPVAQAVRPFAKSLTVSQGKGLTSTVAMISAALESVELWVAETLSPLGLRRAPLSDLSPEIRRLWSSSRDTLALHLDPNIERLWLDVEDLETGETLAAPFSLLSLDFTRDKTDHAVTSNGLAAGNSREEALVAGIAELLEHHCSAHFARKSPGDRLRSQIQLRSISDPRIGRLISRIESSGFELRAWSVGQDFGLPVVQCLLTEKKRRCENLSPSTGSGCHADRGVAFVRALLEAVQSRATLFAGARDDIEASSYNEGRQQEAELVFGSLAFGEGSLAWSDIPTHEANSIEEGLAVLHGEARAMGGRVVSYKHSSPVEELHIHHCLCPGLLDSSRLEREAPERNRREFPALLEAQSRERAVLFAGPSINGLSLRDTLEVRPPAECGDLISLLRDPPTTVGLIDGQFRTARTVWHNEILALLANGCRVIGGASIGAIRAAELDECGMEGVGAIYKAYAAGYLKRDDAVLLIHAPSELGYQPLTVPLVDAECTLALANLSMRDRRMMQRIVRTIDYADRTWKECVDRFASLTGKPFPISLEDLCAAPSIKKADALKVIQAVESARAYRRPSAMMPPQTTYLREMITTHLSENPEVPV